MKCRKSFFYNIVLKLEIKLFTRTQGNERKKEKNKKNLKTHQKSENSNDDQADCIPIAYDPFLEWRDAFFG